MAYTGVDEFGDLKWEKSEEEVVRLYNERVNKVILAWKNLHGLFENIQNDSAIRPLIDQGKPGVGTASTSGGSELPEALADLEFEGEKRNGEEIKETDQVTKEIREHKDKERLRDTVKTKAQASAVLRAGQVVKLSPVKVEIKKREDVEKDVRSPGHERIRKQLLPKMKEVADHEGDLGLGLDREGEELIKKTAHVTNLKEISERKVKERAAGKVKLIGALASELGDEVKTLKDQLQQVKLEKKQLEEKNVQKDKHIRSLVDERKQLLSKICKLSDELNALTVAHQSRSTAEAHHRPGSQSAASRFANKQTTPTKPTTPTKKSHLHKSQYMSHTV